MIHVPSQKMWALGHYLKSFRLAPITFIQSPQRRHHLNQQWYIQSLKPLEIRNSNSYLDYIRRVHLPITSLSTYHRAWKERKLVEKRMEDFKKYMEIFLEEISMIIFSYGIYIPTPFNIQTLISLWSSFYENITELTSPFTSQVHHCIIDL